METGTTIQSLTPRLFVKELFILLALSVCLSVTCHAESGATAQAAFGVSALLGSSAPNIAEKVEQAANVPQMTRATAALNAEVDRVFYPQPQAPNVFPPQQPMVQQGFSMPGALAPVAPPPGPGFAVSFPKEPSPQRQEPDELNSTLQRVHDVLEAPVPPKSAAKDGLAQVESQPNLAQPIAAITRPRLDSQMPAAALGSGAAPSSEWDATKRRISGSDLAIYSRQASASSRLLDSALTLPPPGDGDETSSRWKPVRYRGLHRKSPGCFPKAKAVHGLHERWFFITRESASRGKSNARSFRRCAKPFQVQWSWQVDSNHQCRQ